MSYRKHRGIIWPALLAALLVSGPPSASGQEATRPPEKVARLIWQDREKKTLCWGELIQAGPVLMFQQGGPVPGFPALNPERQELVQMERVEEVLLVGVRDDDAGKFQSGWVAVDLGVDEMPHGDHSDFDYRNPPGLLASCLDASQGNPAHLYVYDDQFFLANDSLSGFTRFLPGALRGPAAARKGTFYRGGGAHITLAAVDQKVAYSTWIPGGGPTKGQIDVVDLSRPGSESIAYSFHLPSGALHGATSNSGKVFFAPADGVDWVDADLQLEKTPETVQPRHLSLGKDSESDRPLRTGAFTCHRNWVIFTTGRQDSSALCLVDAAVAEPRVVQLPIPTVDGLSLVPPEVTVAANGKRYAFVFQNRKQGEIQELLTVVDLDPNGDRDFSDAVIVKTLKVGNSKVDGHYGHHSISFDQDGRFGVLTNPGDGELWILSLDDLTVIEKHQVGGMPTKILVIGGEESKH